MDKNKFRQPTCPWWFLFTFDNPLRKLYQDPEKILAHYIQKGDIAVDLGCGMGYFSIPMARMVGECGRVIAVDLQDKMLSGLRRRAEKNGLIERVTTHQCTQDRIGISEKVDFILAFWMVHEVHDSRSFLEQISDILKPGGKLLVVEPNIHVSKNRFEEIQFELIGSGFEIIGSPSIGFSRSILAQKRKEEN